MNIVKTEELFTFPVIMIDPDKEDERDELTQSLGIKVQEEDPEILIGEAMVPHWDFLFIRDRWNLTEESYKKALLGKFECCLVVFDQCGTFISPLSKEKFLKKLDEFRERLPKPERPQLFMIDLTKPVMDASKVQEGDTGHTDPEGKDRA